MEDMTVDRRVRKTKKQLRQALMHLMAEKPSRSISVRELAERADINRGTFYIHYRDVDDLLQRLEDEMAERLILVCRKHAHSSGEGSAYPYLADLYRFARDNADLCLVLLGPNGDRAYTERICAILRDCFLRDFVGRFYGGDPERLSYFCHFIVSGNLSLTLKWLQDGAKESPEEMAELAGTLIMGGVRVLITQNAQKRHPSYEGCLFCAFWWLELGIPAAAFFVTCRCFPLVFFDRCRLTHALSGKAQIACTLKRQLTKVTLGQHTVRPTGEAQLHAVAAGHLKGGVIGGGGGGVYTVGAGGVTGVVVVVYGGILPLGHHGSLHRQARRMIVLTPCADAPHRCNDK